jgi:prepilin-type N-terminal cleavage/methylation domain-containing protein
MNQKGFTLLEVLVSMALIVVVAFATILTQSGSLSASTRNRQLIVATHLARNLINKKELFVENKPLDSLPDKETGAFEEPNKDFKWTIEYTKVDFSALTDLIARKAAKDGEKNNESADDIQHGQMVMKIFKDYLEKSVRRMKVTIEWPDGKGTSNQTFAQLLVNYDQELNVGL